jgi:ABC-type transport system involved in cytochrome c biogenesis permease subunit
MFKVALLFLLVTTPVLYEGRYRPFETVPKGAHYTPLQVDNYADVAGTCYLQAEGKALKFPTQGQLKAEFFLYKFPFKWLIVAGYTLSFLFFLWKPRVAWLFLLSAFFLHSLALGLRIYILARPPVSNMGETILYVPWIAIGVGFLFRTRIIAPLAASLAAAILLLFLPSTLSLENVQAVLDSRYWLMVHVLMVVGSYGVFSVAGICGHIFLIQKKPTQQLEKTIIQTMYLGTALLIGGTILGGVWAAESWGRFWDWDPKEAWAFISSGVYLMWIHAYRFKKISGRGLAIGAIIGLAAITFTWYGVNYILGSGLHSYGFGNGGEIFYYLYLATELLFIIGILIYKKSEG